jgi:clan AA aspartic protease (TIGR02281 family)
MGGWLLLIASLIATFPQISAAEIFRWTDANGRLHFAQSLNQVPDQYRTQAQQQQRDKTLGSLQTFDSSAIAVATGSSRIFKIPFRRENSLMRVDVVINGHLDVPFYVDTGASGISLPAAYAERLGIAIGPNTARVQVRTANGIISTPLVQLESVKLGGARVDGLMATVNPTTSIGLLGGAFFNNFSYGVDPSTSVITLTRDHAVQTGLGEEHWRRRFSAIQQPLDQLKQYLENREITRKGRREELRQRQASLESKLKELVLEANRVNVPANWRR